MGEIEYYPMDGVDGVEEVEFYNKGGFHPVDLGDILDGRFEVVHKLGHGGFGIVWLCQDIKTLCWRALKIMTADHSAEGRDAKIFEHLTRNASSKQIRNNHIAIPLEQFWIEGPNGRHLCLVSEVFGWNAFDWALHLSPLEEETQSTINNACRQITKGVRFLHNNGIAHGDLRPLNILMKLQGLDKLSRSQVLELTGEPQLAEIETFTGEDPHPHAPKHCVVDVDSYWCKSLSSKSVVIIDFGEAFHVDTPPKSTGIPNCYGAPEVLFEGVKAPSTASDIWSLACTLYELKTHNILFGSMWGTGLKLTLSEMAQQLGPVPQPYQAVYKRELRAAFKRQEEKGEDKEGKKAEVPAGLQPGETVLLPTLGVSPDPIEKEIRREKQYHRSVPNSENLPLEEQEETIKYHYPENDILDLPDLLKKMLKYDPAERISIDEVFYHPWLGGLPPHLALYSKLKKVPASTYLLVFSHLFLLAIIFSLALRLQGPPPPPLIPVTIIRIQDKDIIFPVKVGWLSVSQCSWSLTDL